MPKKLSIEEKNQLYPRIRGSSNLNDLSKELGIKNYVLYNIRSGNDYQTWLKKQEEIPLEKLSENISKIVKEAVKEEFSNISIKIEN